jgi:hypothetical protein
MYATQQDLEDEKNKVREMMINSELSREYLVQSVEEMLSHIEQFSQGDLRIALAIEKEDEIIIIDDIRYNDEIDFFAKKFTKIFVIKIEHG